jgi:hypothetical protein
VRVRVRVRVHVRVHVRVRVVGFADGPQALSISVLYNVKVT